MTDIGKVHPVMPPYDSALDMQLPSNDALMARIGELEKSWETRLTNMKQVIANLDADRERLGARIQTLTVLLETVAEGHPEYTRINTVLTEEW